LAATQASQHLDALLMCLDAAEDEDGEETMPSLCISSKFVFFQINTVQSRVRPPLDQNWTTFRTEPQVWFGVHQVSLN